MKILIIEDNEQIVDVLKRYLNKEEYETAVIHDGKEALPYFEKHSVDFVLLDIMLAQCRRLYDLPADSRKIDGSNHYDHCQIRRCGSYFRIGGRRR